MPDKHQYLIAQYTADALMFDEPWKLWESRLSKPGKTWQAFAYRAPEWRESHEYRRAMPFPLHGTFATLKDEDYARLVFTKLERQYRQAVAGSNTSRPTFVANYPDKDDTFTNVYLQVENSIGFTKTPAFIKVPRPDAPPGTQRLMHPPKIGTIVTIDSVQTTWIGDGDNLQDLRNGLVFL